MELPVQADEQPMVFANSEHHTLLHLHHESAQVFSELMNPEARGSNPPGRPTKTDRGITQNRWTSFLWVPN